MSETTTAATPTTPTTEPAANAADTQNTAPQAAPPKPIDPIETELAAKYGEKFTTLDETIRAQVIAGEKKSRDADRRYQAVAKLQKDHELTQRQAAQLLDLVANDPESVFSNPALMKRLNKEKLVQFAEKIVWEQVQNSRMTPEERELRELRSERAERMASEQARQESESKAKAKAELDERITQMRTRWESEIMKALKEQGIEGADRPFVAQMARYIQAARKQGLPVDLSRIISLTQADFRKWQMTHVLNGFKPRQEGESNEAFAGRYEQWVSRLDPQIVELIRSGDLAKLKHKTMGRPAGSTKSEPRKEEGKKMSMTEWLAKRNERLGRK